ncbi:exopolysaccharide biosynthesis protein EpsL, partial [Acinetobacter baumannii]|nr:exopolysaccharide biosynthesis protein EpsL [Acinetobacter baumannii]
MVLCSFPALSAPKDAPDEEGLRLLGGVGWTYDDNLLRVADGDAPFDGQRSDGYRTLEAGAVYRKAIGRQRIAATAKV